MGTDLQDRSAVSARTKSVQFPVRSGNLHRHTATLHV